MLEAIFNILYTPCKFHKTLKTIYFKERNNTSKQVRLDQVNLLVDRPDRPYFKQKQKNNITKFWPTDFFFNLLFSDF